MRPRGTGDFNLLLTGHAGIWGEISRASGSKRDVINKLINEPMQEAHVNSEGQSKESRSTLAKFRSGNQSNFDSRIHFS